MAGIVVALMLVSPPVAAAAAGRQDIASTRAFLAAARGLLRTDMARRPREVAAADALIQHLETGCPGSLPRELQTGTAAQRKAWTAFTSEAFYEFGLAVLRPLRPAARTAAREMAHLRWTSPALNHQVATFVRDTRIELGLRPPDLCQQLSAGGRTNFTVVPGATRTFLRHVLSASPGSGTTLADLGLRMKPLADRDELTAIAQLRRLQARVDADLSRFARSALARLSRALIS